MIISASRRTDIPTYYSEWLFNRIKEGHVLVRNPMNSRQVSKIDLSPDVVDCIVFWTKNPKPMLEKLARLNDYHYYFQFTLTSYGRDVEAHVPPKSSEVIDTFKRLSDKIGRERVVWRYDPIFLSDRYNMEYHMRYYEKLALQLKDYTETCTISFMDDYPKIRGNVAPLNIQPMSLVQKLQLAEFIAQIARQTGLRVNTCTENIDLSNFEITHARCIDGRLIERIVGCPIVAEKDKNQRPGCGCVASIDIGAYNTCQNGCRYCYANQSKEAVKRNTANYKMLSPLLCDGLLDTDKISERPVRSLKVNQMDLFSHS